MTLDERAAGPGWRRVRRAPRRRLDRLFTPPEIGERDLLTINYTSGTTSRPKGVMITHRNAYMNTVGTLVHIPMTCADRYLWTLPMFHANGWTFTWTVTAAGGVHVCLPKIDPRRVFELIRDERITLLCAAPTVLISLANAPEEARQGVPRGVRVDHRRRSAGRGHHPADGRRIRVVADAGVRTDGNRAVHHGVRGAART